MNSEHDYSLAWKDLGRRHWLILTLTLGYLPVGALIIITHNWLEQQFNFDLLFPIVMLPWFFSIPATAIYLLLFRCPRCNRLFNLRFGNMRWPWTKHCAHCGLKAGELHPSDQIDEDFLKRTAETIRRSHRFGIGFLATGVVCLVAIAVVTSIMFQRLKQPQVVTQSFMQQIQANNFSEAHKLFASNEQVRVSPTVLRKQWQAFKADHGLVKSWQYAGSYNLPTATVEMNYRIMGDKGKEAVMRIKLRKVVADWRIESVSLQDEIESNRTATPRP